MDTSANNKPTVRTAVDTVKGLDSSPVVHVRPAVSSVGIAPPPPHDYEFLFPVAFLDLCSYGIPSCARLSDPSRTERSPNHERHQAKPTDSSRYTRPGRT